MPEEIESPVERLTEDIHEAAEEAKEAWLKWAAVLSAVFAVFAAVAGVQSGHYADQAMLEQIQASDQWSYYQAKGVKALVKESEIHILKTMGHASEEDDSKIEKYRQEQTSIQKDAEDKTEDSKHHLEQHEILARGVTFFQVGIVMIAIGVLTRRRRFVLLSGIFGLIGLYFLITGSLM